MGGQSNAVGAVPVTKDDQSFFSRLAVFFSLEHSHLCWANAILGTRCRNVSQIRRWPVLGVGNNVERARGVANGGQAS